MFNSYQRSTPHLFLFCHRPYGGSIFPSPTAWLKYWKPFCRMNEFNYINPPKCFPPLISNWVHHSFFPTFFFSLFVFFPNEFTSFSLPFHFPGYPKFLFFSLFISLPTCLPFPCFFLPVFVSCCNHPPPSIIPVVIARHKSNKKEMKKSKFWNLSITKAGNTNSKPLWDTEILFRISTSLNVYYF